MNIALRMLFLTLSNAKINFLELELNWRLYTTIETLLTTKQVELIKEKKFVATALDLNDKIFVVYVTSLNNTDIHLFSRAQIVMLI